MGFLPKISFSKDDQRRAEEHRNLIRREAKIGGQLFGPIPSGHQREFFCLDEHTWVWHEAWTDEQGRPQAVTTRYEVRPSGVLKIQNNQAYQSLSFNEALNLYKAVESYGKHVTPLYAHAV